MIDLSIPISNGMPVHHTMLEVKIEVHATHEEWMGQSSVEDSTPSALHLHFSDHTGTHVDALSHMDASLAEKTIDKMPLSSFYSRAWCVDLSKIDSASLITAETLKWACKESEVFPEQDDILLFYSGIGLEGVGSEIWRRGARLSEDAVDLMADWGIKAFGVETPSPGMSGRTNKGVHERCGYHGITHYENLSNLNKLLRRGSFLFMGLPLRIEKGTASPVRAIAIFL